MPRNRLINSNYWSDDKIIKISIPARLLFIALWNYSDDMGIHRNDNGTIKARVFPLDDINLDEVEQYKQELINQTLVIPFIDDRDGDLLFIKNWYKYQYINKPTPSKYKLPLEIIKNFNDDELIKYKSRVISDDYRSSVGIVQPKRKEKKGKEINEKEKNGKELLKDGENENLSINSFKTLQQYLPSHQKT